MKKLTYIRRDRKEETVVRPEGGLSRLLRRCRTGMLASGIGLMMLGSTYGCKDEPQMPQRQVRKAEPRGSRAAVGDMEKEASGTPTEQLIALLENRAALIGPTRKQLGSVKLVKELLAKGANPNVEDAQGKSALWKALWYKRMDIAKVLIESKADVNAKDPSGRIFLIEAVSVGNKELVKLALSKGADVNAKGPGGESALMKAITRRNEMLLQLLIENKADVNATDDYGEPCIWQAWTFARRNSNFLKTLIESGANLEAKSKDGRILIMEALGKDLQGIVRLMVEKGANVNVRDGRGMTPLMLAAESGKTAMCEILLSSKQIDIEAKDDRGETALMKASRRRRTDIVQLLKRHGQAESADPS